MMLPILAFMLLSAKSTSRESQYCASEQIDLAPKIRFPKGSGFSVDKYRHPLDEENTRRIKASPLGRLEGVLRRSLPPVEQTILLDNLSTSVRVSSKQLPELYAALIEAADILNVKNVPDLFVKQNPSPNAYTLAISGSKPFIVVHSSLLELCTMAEVQAVLAHELGHLCCEHGVWLSIGNLAGAGLSTVPLLGRGLDALASDLLMDWQRAAEFSCDRAALLVAQDPKIVTSALLKLVGGAGMGSDKSGELSVDAFLEQAERYSRELSGSSAAVKMSARVSSAARTHPLPVVRVFELDRWAKGPEFHGILARGEAATRD
mmetsp:Transcript_14677/g.24887  ORF Transcript_14677/g.24887 Transcript_14677/m.24887 type:complete len:319 (+) Transcript_14677:65-1021(+)